MSPYFGAGLTSCEMATPTIESVHTTAPAMTAGFPSRVIALPPNPESIGQNVVGYDSDYSALLLNSCQGRSTTGDATVPVSARFAARFRNASGGLAPRRSCQLI